MFMLMSFIGRIAILMANTGFSEVLKSALCRRTEEILIHILLGKYVTNFKILMNTLRMKVSQSRTACLWLDGLI